MKLILNLLLAMVILPSIAIGMNKTEKEFLKQFFSRKASIRKEIGNTIADPGFANKLASDLAQQKVVGRRPRRQEHAAAVAAAPNAYRERVAQERQAQVQKLAEKKAFAQRAQPVQPVINLIINRTMGAINAAEKKQQREYSEQLVALQWGNQDEKQQQQQTVRVQRNIESYQQLSRHLSQEKAQHLATMLLDDILLSALKKDSEFVEPALAERANMFISKKKTKTKARIFNALGLLFNTKRALGNGLLELIED